MNIPERRPLSPYYRHLRGNITDHIRKGPHRVLDVGCGAGVFGELLRKNGYAERVVGIEIDRQAADEAATRLTKVICADINRTGINTLLATENDGPFDYIICADVLEHLIDPWQAMAQLVTHLSPDGRLIASIPNVRHWSVWLPLLLKGHWEYKDAGIMDQTHLRFFTRKTMRELFTGAGLEIVAGRPLIGGKWRLVDRYSMHLLRDFVAVQWVLVGKHP